MNKTFEGIPVLLHDIVEYTMIDRTFTEKKYKTIESQLDNCRFLLSS
jgi:hypothetical protein